MRKAVLLSMCLLGSCGKKIENHYYEKPTPPRAQELEITCADTFMKSYLDLQLHLHTANREYTKLAQFNSVSKHEVINLKIFSANLDNSYQTFKFAFDDVESCNGVLKNKVTTINAKEIITESEELLAKIKTMIDSTVITGVLK